VCRLTVCKRNRLVPKGVCSRSLDFFKFWKISDNISDKNSSRDEIANVNFYAVRPEATPIRRNNAITPFKVIQGHRFWYQSKAYIRFPIIVINTNLPPILHRFRDIAVDRSEIAILGYPSCVLTPPAEGFSWDDLREIFSGCQWMAKVPNAVEILPKI